MLINIDNFKRQVSDLHHLKNNGFYIYFRKNLILKVYLIINSATNTSNSNHSNFASAENFGGGACSESNISSNSLIYH